jgi:hypothetical protein
MRSLPRLSWPDYVAISIGAILFLFWLELIRYALAWVVIQVVIWVAIVWFVFSFWITLGIWFVLHMVAAGRTPQP